MRTGIIYRYLNIESGKSYVGQTINPDKRFYAHKNSKNRDWHVDYQKNPWKYEYSVVEDNIPEDKLDEREIYWITYFDSYNNGYNCTEGGGGVRGCVPWNKGKHHSEETKRKIRESNKGKYRSEETKKKMMKPIIQYSLSGQRIKEWSSTKEAAEYLNKRPGHISDCITGKRKSAYGYMWKYK